MAKYPNWFVGLSQSASNFAAGLPDVYVKSTVETISSDNTLSNDSELSSIPLGVGTFWVRAFIMATCATSATPDLKTRWAFTGTWNSPIRGCLGPAPGNTASSDAVTPSKMRGVATSSDAIYGFPASTAYNLITEEAFNVTVTVAGNLSLQWAQNTSDASNTAVQAGSAMVIRQLA